MREALPNDSGRSASSSSRGEEAAGFWGGRDNGRWGQWSNGLVVNLGSCVGNRSAEHVEWVESIVVESKGRLGMVNDWRHSPAAEPGEQMPERLHVD